MSGANRYEVAANTALSFYDPATTEGAVLAGGTAYADALAGGPLAVTVAGPSLLTPAGAACTRRRRSPSRTPSPRARRSTSSAAPPRSRRPPRTRSSRSATRSQRHRAAPTGSRSPSTWPSSSTSCAAASRHRGLRLLRLGLRRRPRGRPAGRRLRRADPAVQRPHPPGGHEDLPRLARVDRAALRHRRCRRGLGLHRRRAPRSWAVPPATTSRATSPTGSSRAGGSSPSPTAATGPTPRPVVRSWATSASRSCSPSGTTTLPAATSAQATPDQGVDRLGHRLRRPRSVPSGAATNAKTLAGAQTSYYGPDLQP